MAIKHRFPFLVLILLIGLVFLLPSSEVPSHTTFSYDSGDVAWMLMSTALVLIMTPGLAFFYGGMVRKKNVISTMLQSFVSMAAITVLWVVVGFSLAFGDSLGGVIGDPRQFFMFHGVAQHAPYDLAPTIPFLLFALFQLKFAIITPALITGAFAERIRFTSYLLFLVLFSLFIYAPLAHATWHPNGLLAQAGVLDFAGGTVVHMSAGIAALAGAIFLKRRSENEHQPARITYVLLGTGLLWFGWFGFNAGSAFGANALSVIALATTTTASAAASITYILFDTYRGKRPSAMGACIGAVVGLVAITPAAGFVSVPHSMIIGATAAILSNLMIEWRSKTSIDDTLDVFPSHGVGGMVGMLLTGVFASQAVNPDIPHQGLFFGVWRLFAAETIALIGVAIFVFIGTWVLLLITDAITPMRVTEEDEALGLDVSQHNERL
jgi:ammonium transporter, Amt family